jgi:hypothetical protein
VSGERIASFKLPPPLGGGKLISSGAALAKLKKEVPFGFSPMWLKP